MNRPLLFLVVALLVLAVRVEAEPGPADPPEKAKARALLKEGVRLLDAGKLAPALHRFEDAYAAFPSAKILVNIGTAQSGLGRSTDAANTYQRYLDSGNDDPVQLPAVTTALTELDARLGRLAVKLRGAAGAAIEIRVANGAWMSLSPSGVVRVAPGRFDLQVRTGAGSREVNASGAIAAGERKEIGIDLTPPSATVSRAVPPDSAPHDATKPDSPSRTTAPPTADSMSRSATAPESPPEAMSSGAATGGRAAVDRQTHASRWTPLRQGAVAAGAVGVAGLTAMSVLALRARSLWNDARSDMDAGLANRAETRANLATGAGVIGIAALGTGIALWFVGAPRERAATTVTAVIDGTHVGLAAVGSF